jgi:hypothetical protein
MSKGIEDPMLAWGMCVIESKKYAEKHKLGLVRAIGYDYNQREHWAVFIQGGEPEDGKVIDLTARQFSTKVPARYETDLTTWLDDCAEWLGDSLQFELFATHDSQDDSYHQDTWMRDDIDPDNYDREYAAMKMLLRDTPFTKRVQLNS